MCFGRQLGTRIRRVQRGAGPAGIWTKVVAVVIGAKAGAAAGLCHSAQAFGVGAALGPVEAKVPLAIQRRGGRVVAHHVSGASAVGPWRKDGLFSEWEDKEKYRNNACTKCPRTNNKSLVDTTTTKRKRLKKKRQQE